MDPGLLAKFNSGAFDAAELLKQIGEAVVAVDPLGTIRVFNPAAERMFLWPAAEVVGRHISEVVALAESSPLSDKDLELEIRSTGQWCHMLPFRRRDGTTICARATFTLLRDDLQAIAGSLGTFQDATNQQRMEEALRLSEERFRIAAETTTDLVYVWEIATDSVEYFTSPWKPFKSKELLPQSEKDWMERIHPDDVERVQAELATERARFGHFQCEYRMRRGADHWAHILHQASPVVDADGVLIRTVGVLTDITARKEAEREREELQKQLRLTENLESIGRLAGGIAHDFNNLLTVIIGHTQLAIARLASQEATLRSLKEIEAAAARAADLTHQLLAFGRRQHLVLDLVSWNQLLLNSRQLLQSLLGERIGLSLELAPDLPLVNADISELERTLVNLIANARDAMPAGGSLTIRTSTVNLSQSPTGPLPAGSYVTVTVSDTGHGMDQETLQRIFEPFFTTKGSHKGTGLGLSTAYGFIHQSGGHITVESQPGRGSVFTVYLPVCEASPLPYEPASAPSRSLNGSETILVVEDDATVRSVVVRILTSHGYQVLEAADGLEGLAMLRQNAGVKLLLSDVMMPGLAGTELAAQVAKEQPALPVLLVSGHTSDICWPAGGKPEHHIFLPKPFMPDQLVGAVRGLLDKVQAAG